jgi:large conductance mechanosensitive channel
MGVFKEFRDFVMRGNVVDLAVGIIIGAAFGKIVSSLVGDILMPPIGKLLGNVNFTDLFISLDPEKTAGVASLAKANELGAAVIAYGSFISAIIDFVIIAFCVYLIVKVVNRLKRAPEPGPPTTKECPRCISTIPIKSTRCAYCTSDV